MKRLVALLGLLLFGCSDQEVIPTEPTVSWQVSTVECIFDTYDATMLQIVDFLALPDRQDVTDEVSFLALNARDYVQQYCGLTP